MGWHRRTRVPSGVQERALGEAAGAGALGEAAGRGPGRRRWLRRWPAKQREVASTQQEVATVRAEAAEAREDAVKLRSKLRVPEMGLARDKERLRILETVAGKSQELEGSCWPPRRPWRGRSSWRSTCRRGTTRRCCAGTESKGEVEAQLAECAQELRALEGRCEALERENQQATQQVLALRPTTRRCWGEGTADEAPRGDPDPLVGAALGGSPRSGESQTGRDAARGGAGP